MGNEQNSWAIGTMFQDSDSAKLLFVMDGIFVYKPCVLSVKRLNYFSYVEEKSFGP